jgi:hypothetical protein
MPDILLELTRLVRDLAGRVRALEQRSPSWDPWPADIVTRLEGLEQQIAAMQDSGADSRAGLPYASRARESGERTPELVAYNAVRRSQGWGTQAGDSRSPRVRPGSDGSAHTDRAGSFQPGRQAPGAAHDPLSRARTAYGKRQHSQLPAP